MKIVRISDQTVVGSVEDKEKKKNNWDESTQTYYGDGVKIKKVGLPKSPGSNSLSATQSGSKDNYSKSQQEYLSYLAGIDLDAQKKKAEELDKVAGASRPTNYFADAPQDSGAGYFDVAPETYQASQKTKEEAEADLAWKDYNLAKSLQYQIAGDKALSELNADVYTDVDKLAQAWLSPDIYNTIAQGSTERLRNAGYTDAEIEQLVDYRKRQINRSEYDEKVAKTENLANNGFWGAAGASAVSVPQQLLSGAGYIDLALQKLQNAYSGNDRPLDYYTQAMGFYGQSNAARSTVTQNIEDNAKTELGGKIGSFLYNTGMSMADFISVSPLGGAGMALLGSGAATATAVDIRDRGGDDTQALLGGALAGAAEAVFENESLKSLFALSKPVAKETLRSGFKRVLTNIGKQGWEEGKEELFTTLANAMTDRMVMGELSSYNTAIRDYMAQGLSEEEAERKATLDFIVQCATDTLAGFVSGGVMGGVTTAARGYANYSSYDAKDLVDEALEINPDNAYAQGIKAKLDEGKRVGVGARYKLVQQNEPAMRAQDKDAIQSAAAEQLTGLGEDGDVQAIAAAIAKQTAGEKLDKAEKAAIKDSEHGAAVAEDLNPDNTAEWARQISTNKVNRDAYNADLEALAEEVVSKEQQADAEINKASEIGSQRLAANDQVYQTASKMFGEDKAFAVAAAYRSGANGLSAGEFLTGFAAAHQSGVKGTSLEKTLAAQSKLRPEQVKIAWSLGNDERTSRIEVRNIKQQGTGTFTDKTTGKATDSWQAFTTVLEGIAKRTGIDFETVDAIKAGKKTANGKMIRDMMTIVLSRNAENNMQSLGHELGEFVEAFNPEDMATLRVDILRYWAKTQSATSVDKMIKAYQGTYKQAEGGKTYEQAESEAINDALGAILASEEGVDALMEWLQSDSGMNAQEQKTFLQKLADLFQSIVNALKNLLSNGKLTPMQQDMVHMEIEQKQDILKRLFAAVDQAALNARETGEYYADITLADEAHSLPVYDYSKSFAEQIEDYKSGNIPQRDTLLVGGTPDVFKMIGMSALPMTINQTHVDYALNGTKDFDHYIGEEGLRQLPDALKKPVAIIASKTKNGTSLVAMLEVRQNGKQVVVPVVIDGFGYLNGIQIDSNAISSVYGKNFSISKVLRDALEDEANGKRFSVYYVDKQKAIGLLRVAKVPMPKMLASSPDGVVNKITDFGSPVKPKYSSVTETQQFKRWFGDSKVVNADGTPKVMYHGTADEFTIFDPFIKGGKNGVAEGYGLYFADTPKVSEAYGGKLMSVYVKIAKPATSYKKTIKQAALAKLIKATCEAEAKKSVADGDYDSVKDAIRDTWVSNYVYTYGTSMDAAYMQVAASIISAEDHDMGIVQEVMAGMGIRDYKSAYDFYETLTNVMGIDGFITKWKSSELDGGEAEIAVAFYSQQVKSATDNIGTFDGTNPDIRYSLPVAGKSMTEMTNREILAAAAEQVDTTAFTNGERDALRIFNSRLDKLGELQSERKELGELYREQMFVKGKVDRVKAANTRSRMNALDQQIAKAENDVLKAESTEVLKQVLKQARKVVANEQRARDDNTLRRYKERRENAASVKKYRERIQKKSMKLTEMLVRNSDKQHIPEQLKVAVGDFLTSIDFTSKRQLRGGEATTKDLRYTDTLNKLRRVLQNQVNYMEDPEKSEGLGVYLDMPDEFVQAIDQHIESVEKTLRNTDVATGAVNAMTADELKDLDFFLTVLTSSINKVNAFIANSRYELVSEAAMNSIAYLNEMREFGGKHTKVDKFFNWDNTTPAYAFKRFGDAGSAIFEGLQDGWDKLAFNSKQVIDFAQETYTEKEVKEWSEKIHDIDLDGRTAKMTTAQIMSLYCLVKREQARGHLFGGGMRIGNIEIKGKVKGKQDLQQAEAFHLTMEDVERITKLLTERQVAVAEAMQKYMNTVGSKWGNEISFSRFGYNSFTEENYFPIESDRNNLPAIDPETRANDLFRLLNMCFTKGLTPKANNALVVNNIFDVFAAHMSDMAKYNALALPVLDAMKFYNFKDSTKQEGGKLTTATVQKAIERAYGGSAKSYFIQFMKDLNGVHDGGRNESESFAMKMVGNYKVAAVGANLRVAFLQPTSYVRAVAVIDPKYLTKAVTMKPATKEMLEHSGVAVWKSLGFYDTNIGRAVRDQIKGEATVRDKLVEASMSAAALGDKLTWGVLWNACKLECAAKGEKSTEAVAKRFREVVYATQVVDSTMTRSQTMRSNSSMTKMLTSFMSEPTLAYNMLVDSYNTYITLKRKGDKSAWKKCSKAITRSMMAYVASMTAAALAESLFDALRDDDDYETFLEKFWEAFWGDKYGYDGKPVAGNLAADLNLLNKLPIIKDIVSEITGYENTRMDTQWFSSIIDAVEAWKSDTRPLYGKIYKTMQALSRVAGLPVSNLMREVVTIYNNTIGVITGNKLKTYEGRARTNINDAMAGGHLTEDEAMRELVNKGEAKDMNEAYFIVKGWGTGDTSRYQDVYDAMLANESIAAAVKELTDHGYEKKDVLSTVKSQIGKWYKGTDDKPASITRQQALSMLVKYGELTRDEANSKLNTWDSQKNQ